MTDWKCGKCKDFNSSDGEAPCEQDDAETCESPTWRMFQPNDVEYHFGEQNSKNPFDTQYAGSHYKIDGVMDVAEWCMRRKLEAGEMNVVKYVCRHEKKNGLEDLRKAQQYLQFIAWVKYGENL